MKVLVVVSLIALTLTTGFTCSKNPPPEATQNSAPAQDPAAQPSQEQMAQPAPADGAEAPVETAPPAEGEVKQ